MPSRLSTWISVDLSLVTFKNEAQVLQCVIDFFSLSFSPLLFFLYFYIIYLFSIFQPSSCLSDKEEDEIYGFAGYGVYGKQMLQRQQQRKLLAHNPTGHAQGYQTCLSPRSAYFYEFPPTGKLNFFKVFYFTLSLHLRCIMEIESLKSCHPEIPNGTWLIQSVKL